MKGQVQMQKLFLSGVDQITTNNPLAARTLLGPRELQLPAAR